MNRRQREQVENLGRLFQEAITDVISMGEEKIDEEMYVGSPTQLEPVLVEEQRVADYRVEIAQVNNGFVVTVGCQTFVFEKFETASKYIDLYFQNPSETTRKHYEGTLFK